MNAKLILGLSLLCPCLNIGAVGESAYYKQAVKLGNQKLAESVWAVMDTDSKTMDNLGLFKAKFIAEPKAMGGAVDVPKSFKDDKATTAKKFADLFGTGEYNYGTKVLEQIKKEGDDPKTALDNAKTAIK